MKEELRYNWLDLLRAPRMALSLQKIWMEFPPLLIGYAFYVMCAYLALMNDGDFTRQASVNGLLPCLAGAENPGIVSWLLWCIGLGGLFAAMLFAGTAVARATFLELKGETFFIYRELYAFSCRFLKSTLLGPLGILAVIAGIALCGYVVGLIGRIPAVGVIPVVALSPIWLGVAFFLVVLLVVFLFSVLLAPAVVATLKGDFFEVITETFSITFSQLCRMVWYQIVIGVISTFSVAVLGGLVALAYRLMTGILRAGMGDDFGTVTAKAEQVLHAWLPQLCRLPEGAQIGGWLGFWGCILAAVATLAGFLVVACFGMAAITAGNTIAYVVLHKIKDEEDLLELEEEEEEDEAAKQPPPAAEAPPPAAAKPPEEPKPPEETPKS